jgi:hypothetical protein
VWRRCGTFFSASRPAPRSPSCYTAFCQVIVVLLSRVIIVLSVRSHRPLWYSVSPCLCRPPIISLSLSLSSFKFIVIRLGHCRFCYRSLSPFYRFCRPALGSSSSFSQTLPSSFKVIVLLWSLSSSFKVIVVPLIGICSFRLLSTSSTVNVVLLSGDCRLP